jgi:hypothetical protein
MQYSTVVKCIITDSEQYRFSTALQCRIVLKCSAMNAVQWNDILFNTSEHTTNTQCTHLVAAQKAGREVPVQAIESHLQLVIGDGGEL